MSDVDDALDRLERDISFLESVIRSDEGYTETVIAQCIDAREDIATMRDALERLREERDAALDREAGTSDALDEARTWKSTAEIAGKRVGELEAEARRLTEGLREYGHHKQGCNQLKSPGLGRSPEFSGQECDCGLAALLSASPSDGGGA